MTRGKLQVVGARCQLDLNEILSATVSTTGRFVSLRRVTNPLSLPGSLAPADSLGAPNTSASSMAHLCLTGGGTEIHRAQNS